MTTETVVLSYLHAGRELSTGSVILWRGIGTDATLLEKFEKATYVDMMKRFAKHVAEHPTAEGAIQRTDRPGLVLLRLPADEVALFRTDPVEAIRQRMFAPVVVHVGVDHQPAVEPAVSAGLDAGLTTLSQYFGDLVYLRARKQASCLPQVECVGCGRWADVTADEAAVACPRCLISVPVVFTPGSPWAGVKVTSLIAIDIKRFFIPRRWNTQGNWITRGALTDLYNKYNKEKVS